MLQHMASPVPAPIDLTREKIEDQQAELVRVDADFLTRRDGPGNEVVLQCRTGKWFFEALLPNADALPADLRANDRLGLTGICELTTTRALPFASSVDGFRLHLRDAEDVVTLHRAPWWTLRQLLWALSIIGAVALTAIVWAALLRRQVAEQTKVIGTQIERAAVKDERQRIARELHDTIEQELAGLSVQLRNARQRLANAPEQAGNAIELSGTHAAPLPRRSAARPSATCAASRWSSAAWMARSRNSWRRSPRNAAPVSPSRWRDLPAASPARWRFISCASPRKPTAR